MIIKNIPFKVLVFLFLMIAFHGNAQQNQVQSVPLNDFSFFKDPGKNWHIASDAFASLEKIKHIEAIKGMGAIVNIPSGKQNAHLFTREEHGDIELELEFMMARQSNSGVYLMGRYEIQLFDSWKKRVPSSSDCGGLYQRWDESVTDRKKGYHGVAPAMNASKAPGLWQHLKIRFRAPRFDADGNKIANAKFETVTLNGALVHHHTEATGPTRSAYFEDEKSTGPLMLQGDHGPVAFKNIKYRLLNETDTLPAQNRYFRSPVFISAESAPYLLRSFINHRQIKRTHTISVGNPERVHYAYDLKQGSILQIWRGDFMEAADMWHRRGTRQTATPLGAIITFSSKPTLAVLSNANADWPDSVYFDDMLNKGYLLDRNRHPTFQYEIKDIKVDDKIAPAEDGSGFARTISIDGAAENLYCKLAEGSLIQHLKGNLYAVDGKSYYIRVNKSFSPVIRTTNVGQELLVPIKNKSVNYSITW